MIKFAVKKKKKKKKEISLLNLISTQPDIDKII